MVSVSPLGEDQDYQIIPGSSEAGDGFQMIEEPSGTLMIPDGVDLSKLDRMLFNVDYLLSEGYQDLPSLPVVIVAGGESVLPASVEIVTAHGGGVSFSFADLAMLAVDLPLTDVGETSDALLAMPEVSKIWLDMVHNATLDVSVPLIGAPQVWDAGFKGNGVEIAILDSGIQTFHPDLDDLDDDLVTDDPKVLHEVNFSSDSHTGVTAGHGRSVAIAAAGTGYVTSGDLTGVAPMANLWNVKVLNSKGSGLGSSIVAGIEYATKGPDGILDSGDDDADIINMNLGGPPGTDAGGRDPVSMAMDWATDHGLVVVTSASNWGARGFILGSPAGTHDLPPIVVPQVMRHW